MQRKIVAVGQQHNDLKRVYEEFINILYPEQARQETPENISRYLQHMQKWFMALNDLEKYSADTIPERKVGIYKLYKDAPQRKQAAEALIYLQKIYLDNKVFVDVIAVLHDIGKMKSNLKHELIGVEKYYEIYAEDFAVIKSTIFYQSALAKLSYLQKQILPIIIENHTIGCINMDGNYGHVYKIQKDLAVPNLGQENKDNFYKILELIVNLDRAAVGDLNSEGFMTFYDFKLFNEKLNKMLSTQNIFDKPEDIAGYITEQFVMFAPDKKLVYQNCFPRILEIMKSSFSTRELSMLQALLNKKVNKILSGHYIDGYLFHYAFLGNLADRILIYSSASLDQYKKILERFSFIKLLITLVFPEQEEKIKKYNEYSTTPLADRDIFNVAPEQILSVIKKYLNGEKTESIFK